MEKQFLSYDETATLLNIKVNSLYSLVHRKEIPFFRFGRRIVRFEKECLLTWIQEKKFEDRKAPPIKGR